MQDSLSDAVRGPHDAESDGKLHRLAESIGREAGVERVYGAPVERDGVTVVPVASVRWGFGGGFGEADSGSGGGGGVRARPVGFIEIRGGEAQFRPLRDPVRLALTWLLLPASAAAAALVMLAAAWLMMRSVRKSLRPRLPWRSRGRHPRLADIRHPHLPEVHLPEVRVLGMSLPDLADVPRLRWPESRRRAA